MIGKMAYNASFKSIEMNRKTNVMLDSTQQASVMHTAKLRHIEIDPFHPLGLFSSDGNMRSQINTRRLIRNGSIFSSCERKKQKNFNAR